MNTYDCIVIGGGPAGCTTAALVAEAGFPTLLLEREQVPRFHIGESLMPETYWTLKRLGVLEEMKQSHFPQKLSVQFVSNTGKESQPFYFHDRDPRECSQTWQVLRSEFDEMLWKNAARKGAECRDRARVLDVLFEGPHDRPRNAIGVRLAAEDKKTEDLHAKVIVDATGQQSVLGNKLGIRAMHPRLRKAAIWGYYEHALRDPGVDSGATIILHTKTKEAWFWFIPLHDEITSIGVVGDVDYLLKGRGTPDEVFAMELNNCSSLVGRLTHAKLVSEYRVLREFSYTSSQAAGDGWVLVGDAYAFLDPIYSSGVFLALKSGELAADAIIGALQTNDLSGARLGAWAEPYYAGVERIAKLIYAFYDPSFSFGKFMMSHPEHQGNLTDLLVGKVFHEEAGQIFNDMEPWIAAGASDAPCGSASAVGPEP